MRWDPTLYSAFAAPRARPALDLLARVTLEEPRHVVDLGCGTGNITRLLATRWPEAQVYGVDSSAEMLTAAAAAPSSIRWTQAGIDTWTPEQTPDLLFSNAALHWLDDHATLLPRLIRYLAPGGVLAVQVPHNHYAASHTVMAETAAAGPWAERLAPLVRSFPVEEPAFYYDLLAPLATSIDIWETEYLHVLEGDEPVVRWTMGTALRPVLAALTDAEREDFLAAYGQRIAQAYPRRHDGHTLFPFRRLFMVISV